MKTSFWCTHCGVDFDKEAIKSTRAGCEYFFSFCPKNHKVVRYITERKIDPYYRVSKKAKQEMIAYKRDLIQPGQDGFQTYYKDSWDKIQKASEEYERKQLRKKMERESYYKKLREDISTKYIASKIIEQEERM